MFISEVSSDSTGPYSNSQLISSFLPRKEALSPKLWKDLCKRTGKLHWKNFPIPDAATSKHPHCFLDLYYRIPCVPCDFATIKEAIDKSPPGTTITLLPGLYGEKLNIAKSVRIRAADPRKGAALVWYHPNKDIFANQSVIEVTESCTYVSLHNLSILHYTKGADIWNGNCAIFCHGDLTHTHVEGCSIQSDSGRGIVVAGGASLKVSRSSIHDCAATGLYLGDSISLMDITSSNIIRNGFGCRRNQVDARESREPEIVQSGHSGLYIEGAEAEIRDTLVAENCLTGISVVRHGSVHICDSHIVGNGEEPIAVFQEIRPARGIDGGIVEHSNYIDRAVPPRDELEKSLLRYPKIQHHKLSIQELTKQFTAKARTR